MGSLDALPDEILWTIALYLSDFHDLANFARASRRTQTIVRDRAFSDFNAALLRQRLNLCRPIESWLLDSVREIRFHPSTCVTSVLSKAGPECALERIHLRLTPDDAMWRCLLRLPSLRALSFSTAPLTHVGHRLPKRLEYFSSDATCVTDDDILLAFAQMPRLQQLHIGNASRWADYDLAALESLTETLTQLSLQRCNHISRAGLARIANLQRLTHLDLSGSFLTDATMSLLSHHPSLEEVRLLTCENASLFTANALATIPTLRVLDLSSCFRIDDRCLASIATIPHLNVLRLNGCGRITSEGVSHLSAATSLTELDLSSCIQLQDDSIVALDGLTLLRTLSLRGCSHLTDSVMEAISTFSLLSDLDISCLPLITDAGVRHLQLLPLLRRLALGECHQVTEDSFAAVGHIHRLADLSLKSNAHLGDAAIMHLRNCGALRRLDVTHCARISFQATVKALAHIRDIVIVKTA